MRQHLRAVLVDARDRLIAWAPAGVQIEHTHASHHAPPKSEPVLWKLADRHVADSLQSPVRRVPPSHRRSAQKVLQVRPARGRKRAALITEA
ncbi:MAG: hypothetical protein AB7G13_12065 [Lautropia sp.]